MTRGGRWYCWRGTIMVALWGLWLGTAGSVDGDAPVAAPVPQRPRDGVHDAAGLFSTEQRRAAAAAIAEARNDGVAFYLAAFPGITGETIEQRAERLKAAWCGREVGLVVVVDASTNRCTFLSHLSENEWLSSDRLRAIFQDATTASTAKKTAGERLLSVVQHLVAQIRSALASRPPAASNTTTFRAWTIFGAVLGACALLGLGVLVAFRAGRRVSSNRLEPAFFPTVVIEPRFGGEFAGGVAAEVQFRPPRDES